jgi:hypothetical protein
MVPYGNSAWQINHCSYKLTTLSKFSSRLRLSSLAPYLSALLPTTDLRPSNFSRVQIPLTFVHFLLFFFTSQKVSVVQHKVLHPFHRSLMSECRARVPCHELCRPKLPSSSYGPLLFLKICLAVFVTSNPILLLHLPCPADSLLVLCLHCNFYVSYCIVL